MPATEQSININAPVDKIWEMVKNPNQWPNWFEGATQSNVVSGNGEIGTEVEVTMTVAKIPLPSKLKVTEFVPGDRWKGEFESLGLATGHMLWTYMNMGSRTKLTFHIEAELSGAAKVAEGMVIKSFEEMAQKTLLNVKSMVEG
ncbi:MAG: SRPBCC family protein [Anaerolineae bacterium]|nr:SRPBCC family protein [Anaerolineae bacterium]